MAFFYMFCRMSIKNMSIWA